MQNHPCIASVSKEQMGWTKSMQCRRLQVVSFTPNLNQQQCWQVWESCCEECYASSQVGKKVNQDGQKVTYIKKRFKLQGQYNK